MATGSSKDIPVVFLGSGPVAAASLELLAHNFTIEAVITKPRPEHHKGPVPVLDLYQQRQDFGRLLTVTNKSELSSAIAREQFGSRLGVVIDFGIIIAQDVIDAFPLGIINSHFSLLPEWRGADPITFSILSGQKQTGVSLMRITAGLDEGPLLAQLPYVLADSITTPLLTKALIKLSDEGLHDILPLYVQGKAKLGAQKDVTIAASKQPTFSRKLTKADGVLDFNKPALQLEREVRAYLGWPGSKTVIAGKDVTITEAHLPGYEFHSPGIVVGSIFPTPDELIGIACSQGVLIIDKLKPAGKAEITARAFLNGYGKEL